MIKTKFFYIAGIVILSLVILPAVALSYNSWTKNNFSEKGNHGWPKLSGNGEYAIVLEHRSVSNTGNAWLLNTVNGQTIWKFDGKNKTYYDADISNDGSYIVLAGTELVLLSKNSSQPLWRYTPKRAVIYNRVAISQDGTYIAVGTRGGEVRLFKQDSAKELFTWKTCKDWVNALAISADGKYIVAGGTGSAVLIQTDRQAIINTFVVKLKNNKADKITSVAISNDGKNYTVATYGGKLSLFNRDQSQPLWTADSGSGIELKTKISNSGNDIVLVSNNKYWGFTADSAASKWKFVNKGNFPDLDTSDDGKYIAVADQMNNVYVFDRDFKSNGDETRPLRLYSSVSPNSISISGQGDKIIYNEKGGLKFRDVTPGILSEIDDSVPVYRTGDEMNVRTFISDPTGQGQKKYQLEVHLSLPQMDFWKIAGRAVKNKLDSMIPKELSKLATEAAKEGAEALTGKRELPSFDDVVPYTQPAYVLAPGSSDQQVAFIVPKLNGKPEPKEWTDSFDIVGKAFDRAFNYFGDLLKQVLPDNMANWITSATKAYVTGESNLETGMQPAIGMGQVFLKDINTGEVIDTDTFIFAYILEG